MVVGSSEARSALSNGNGWRSEDRRYEFKGTVKDANREIGVPGLLLRLLRKLVVLLGWGILLGWRVAVGVCAGISGGICCGAAADWIGDRKA